MIKFISNRIGLSLGALCLIALCSACTPRPSDRYMLSRGAELKPGASQMLVLQEKTDRKKLATDLAQAVQTCLLNRNTFFSGISLEGPKQTAADIWQITLRDDQEQAGHGRDVIITIGNPPKREGILKALPKEVSLGEGSVSVKRAGAVNRTDSVLGVVADSISGLSPCDGIPATGISLVGRMRKASPPTAAMPVPQYPLPKLYPKFYR